MALVADGSIRKAGFHRGDAHVDHGTGLPDLVTAGRVESHGELEMLDCFQMPVGREQGDCQVVVHGRLSMLVRCLKRVRQGYLVRVDPAPQVPLSHEEAH